MVDNRSENPDYIILDLSTIERALYDPVSNLEDCEFCLPDAINILCDYIQDQEDSEIALEACLQDIVNDHAANDAYKDGLKIARTVGVLGNYLIDVFRSTNAYDSNGTARYILDNKLFFDDYVLRKIPIGDALDV